MAHRNFSNIAVETTISSGIDADDTTLTVASATGWPAAPFTAILEEGTAQEEIILVGNKGGNVFSSITRGFGGTSGTTHSGGAAIKHVGVAADLDAIYTHDHAGDPSGTISHDNLTGVSANDHHSQQHAIDGADHTGQLAHTALSGLTSGDPHTQYLKEKASGGVAAEIPEHTHAGASTGGTIDHGALTGLGDDDHTQYLKEKASGGTAAEVPEHTHAAAAQGGVLSLLDIQIYDEAADTGLQDSVMSDMASFTWNRPSGWTSYDLLIMGFGYYENAGSTRTVQSRVKAGANQGVLAAQFGGFGANGASNTGPLTLCPIAKFTGLSNSSLTIAMEALMVGGGGSVFFRAGNIVVFATRVS